MARTIYIFDFDSTFIQGESLELLAAQVLANDVDRESKLQSIAKITELAMAGKMDYSEALKTRLAEFTIHQQDIQKLTKLLADLVSTSIEDNRWFFQQHAQDIYIISSSFIELVWPVVSQFGIANNHVYANEFYYDHTGKVVGLNLNCPLAKENGKAEIIKFLANKSKKTQPNNTQNMPQQQSIKNIDCPLIAGTQHFSLDDDLIMIGDGYNDYLPKEAGVVKEFIAYTENVSRPEVVGLADKAVANLDELIQYKLLVGPKPKQTKRALLLENIHVNAVSNLKKHGFEVVTLNQALEEDDLIEQLQGFSFLGIRSKTKVTAKVIQSVPNLAAVGAFCIGTNQIDLERCTEKGVAVFNAPYSNTRSVVELSLASIIMLARGIIDKSAALHAKQWHKSSKGAHEVRGKTLGIIGYGNIGSQLSIVAEALGMQIIFYDIAEKLPLGNAKKAVNMEEVLRVADYLSIHVDGNPNNHNLIDANIIQKIKPGAMLLNLSRGHVIDLNALAAALKSKHLAGAAIDVYPEEPKTANAEFFTELQGLDNVILTPHIGGSTEEAQAHIGTFVSTRLIQYIERGVSIASVNFPPLQVPEIQGTHRVIHIHRNVPGILAALNKVFGEAKINIAGQYLKTGSSLGYVITDIEGAEEQSLRPMLEQISDTLKVRFLY